MVIPYASFGLYRLGRIQTTYSKVEYLSTPVNGLVDALVVVIKSRHRAWACVGVTLCRPEQYCILH